MPSDKKVRVAIVGLGFGAEFIPIYQAHPKADMYAVCRRNKAELDKTADRYKVAKRYASYEELLKDPNVDAVHINSPIPDHGPQSIAALKAGKHVACTVPMATTKEQIREIVELQRKTGKTYMMMETVVYSREYLFVKELYDKGELGRIQFLRGSHQQDMDGWPEYWPGLPPMWYATHCVSPCLAILSKPGKPAMAEYVTCYGSGRIPDSIRRFTQPQAIQDADHLSFLQGGGHGGSHPHLVHHFLQAALGRQPAFPDAPTSANWTMVGLCAHQSALKGGERVNIPV